MVNAAATTGPAEAERRLALSYAPAAAQAGLAALIALDDRLATIVRSAREPMIGQMRLTWWYEALVALDTAAVPAEPVLAALHAAVLPHGVDGATLAVMIDGWERLLDPAALDDAAMAAFAAARGGTLFAAMARLCSAPDAQPHAAGEGWALADLAAHLGDANEAARARAMAIRRIDASFDKRWPRPARAIGALALLARFDVMTPSPPRAGPRRVLRLVRHRWNGS